MTVNGPMTRADRVATLEEAKAQFQKSWDAWKAWRSWKRCHRLALPPTPEAEAVGKEKPRRRWGQSGAFNGRFALGWVRPGHRTERRGQDDTPKRKMVRARLPSLAEGPI